MIVTISATAVEVRLGKVDGGDIGGGCTHRNRCLRVKAAFAGSAKLPANTAFAVRAAIMAVVWWWWDWWWDWRLVGGLKRLFTTRNGFTGGTDTTTKRLMGAAFYRRQLERPAPAWPLYRGLYLLNATLKRFAKTDLDATTTTNGTPTNYQHPTVGPDHAPLFNEINNYKAKKESREEQKSKKIKFLFDNNSLTLW